MIAVTADGLVFEASQWLEFAVAYCAGAGGPAGQRTPPPFGVIVADDGSADDSRHGRLDRW
ncbi:MAG TPA: hypothetical protein VHZ03_22660 [Trebonia sp.]|nr:hypothetical protein [Trebonia sp.]